MTLLSEAQRQQALLELISRIRPAASADELLSAASPQRLQRGLAAYQAHAGATAERALGAAYPTIAALVGDEAFAAIARRLWKRHPPTLGDLGEWGAALSGFVADDPPLADWPWLADVARLEWALHQAARAADAPAGVAGLALLGDMAPESLWLRCRPGHAVIASPWPIATLHAAHKRTTPDRLEPVRQAFADRRGETVRVWREGLQARLAPLGEPEAVFDRAVLEGASLEAALRQAGPGLDFERWLIKALQNQVLRAVETTPPRNST